MKTRNEAGKYILTGIAFAAIAALIFMNELSPHPWFNHISASHVIMAVAATFFYLGAIRIEMNPEQVVPKVYSGAGEEEDGRR